MGGLAIYAKEPGQRAALCPCAGASLHLKAQWPLLHCLSDLRPPAFHVLGYVLAIGANDMIALLEPSPVSGVIWLEPLH